jgi:Asp-tRNA(Asn)/Glu-tRNA(Gln) amidotransferase A subunit family amidase
VSDAALILQAIAGFDAADINSRELPLVDYKAALGSSIKGLRIGVPREVFLEGLDREVDAAFSDALQMLGTITADQREVSVPLEKDRTVANCESYVYHARYLAKSPDLYHPSTLARILAGEKVTAIQYIEGKQKLETTRRAVLDLFTAVDVLVTPTTPVPAPRIAELEADQDNLRKREVMLLRNTRPFNVLGLPAISIPFGVTGDGLPIGLQIAGAPGREDQVLAVAQAMESQIG